MAQPLSSRSQWVWHLTDSRDESPFESEYRFHSAIDAERSGRARLAELAQSSAGQGLARRAKSGVRNHLIIVSQSEQGIHALLSRVFQAAAGIAVIRDRRQPSLTATRRPERRSQRGQVVAQGQGWLLICLPAQDR